jgi:hypothetical protein
MKIARHIILLAVICAIGITTTLAAPIESVESVVAKPSLQKVGAFLNEKAVADQLTKLGVTPAQAEAKIARLDDQQLRQLAAQVDELKAGGDIESGHPHPLGPFGCVLKRLGDTIAHVFKLLFCWTDIP